MLIGYTIALPGPYLLERLGDLSDFADGYKTDWAWSIPLEDGLELDVYNYKDGPSYGYEESRFEDPREWHISLDRLGRGPANVGERALESRALEAVEKMLGAGTCIYREARNVHRTGRENDNILPF